MANLSAGGGGGGGDGGSQGVRVVENPFGSGQPVIVGGVELITTESDQSSGQDAPKKSMERGYQITQRNVLVPNSGTITGAVNAAGIAAINAQVRKRNPIAITTPAGHYAECVVTNIDLDREGKHIDKFGVSVEWSEILIAETGTQTVRAITADGNKSPSAKDAGPPDGEPSLVKDEKKSTNNGPNVNTGQNATSDGNSSSSGGGSDDENGIDGDNTTPGALDVIGNAIGNWL